jgi:hypothetical protein
MPYNQEASPATLEEHLLHPVNLKAAKVLKAGGTSTAPSEIALKVGWSPNQAKYIHEQVISWLKTGDTKKLVALLREEPTAITHPMVFWQLFHLRQVLRMTSEEERAAWEAEGYGGLDPKEKVLPEGVKPAAYTQLQQILSAWVRALLPGHTVEPPKPYRRRGRNAKWSTNDKITILTEFGELSTALNEIEEAGPAEVAPKKNESRAKFLKRMEAVVQRLNTHTLENWVASIETPATETKGAVLKKQRPSLPDTVTSKIVRQAVPDKRPSKNKLLYGILAHHYLRDCCDIEIMRGLIEHAEADFPELDSRRLSHTTPTLKSKK